MDKNPETVANMCFAYASKEYLDKNPETVASVLNMPPTNFWIKTQSLLHVFLLKTKIE